MGVEIVKLMPSGEITIPVGMIENIALKAGDELMAYQSEDFILLKPIRIPQDETAQSVEEHEWTEGDNWTDDERMEYVSRLVKEFRAEIRAEKAKQAQMA